MPHSSSYSNSQFDYSGIKLDGTHAYNVEHGPRTENINNSSRLSEDTDDLRIENYISHHLPIKDHQNNEHPITSHGLPNYSTRYSRFICRNGHHSACEHNKGVLDETKGRFDHLLQTDNSGHITELPHTTSNPDSFSYTPSDEGRNTHEGKSWVYSVGTQDFSNKGVNVLGTDYLWEEENTNHKVNYALSPYKNKFPGKEYRIKESHYYENPVTGLPGVLPKYDEGAGNLYSMESATDVDSARKGMHNKAKHGNEVPRAIILDDGTGNFKISGKYVLHNRVGKYDSQNTGHSENQHHYYVQGGTGGNVLGKTDIIPLPPIVHRRQEIVPGYIYPTDITNNYKEIVFLTSPKYHNYASEEQYGKNEDLSNNEKSTNIHDEARWKRSQIKRKSSYVHPTKAYPWQHQQIFPINTKFVQDSNPECNSRVTSPCTESVNNRDIPFHKLKNKLFGIQLQSNTQYLDDSDKYEGDLLFRNTTEYIPEIYNVKNVKNCKYPVFCRFNEYHGDGSDFEAEEDMGSDQSILYSTNAGNNFQTDKKLNHQTYRDLTFVRNDNVIKANSPLILNAILTSVERNGEQGNNHQREHNLKCKRINTGEKQITECFAAQSDRKYINGQRIKEFLTQEKANIEHHVEDSFLPGKYDYVLPLQQNIEHNVGVHNTETWTQNVGNPDIYIKTAFPYAHFNHHRSDRSSSENTELEDDVQNYQTYGVRGPQYIPQFQIKVGNTHQSVDFSPTGAEEKPSHLLPQINEEYFTKSTPQNFSPQGRNLELNNGRFPGNTIDKANLIRPSNRIKEEKTTDETYYLPVSYEQAVNNLSTDKEQADKILSSNAYGHTDRMNQYNGQDLRGFNDKEKHGNIFDYALDAKKDDGVLRNLHVHEYNSDHVKANADPSEEVKNLDYWELNKYNPRIGTEDITSKMPVRFDSYAFLKESELNPEIKSKTGLKNNKLNADKGFETSDEALLPNKDIKYSQGYDYNSRSWGINLDKPKFIINNLGKTENLLSPELSEDALQLQIEESMGKMLGKYGHEETNTSSWKNENWSRRNKKIDTGMKLNDHGTEKIYLGINSMAEDSEANKIEFKSKIQLPYNGDKEGRDTIQYNNIHNTYHIPNNLKAVEQSKIKTYYDEDMEDEEKERSNTKYASAEDATVPSYNHKETTALPGALYEAYKQWQLRNGIFGVPKKCDGCIQEHRDGRVLKTTETARHSLLGKFTVFNTDSVAVPNTDVNYSQQPDYNTHSLDASLNKPKFNINKLDKTEDLSLDLSDDALQFQIEESMSKMVGKNKFTNTNVPLWKNKDWGHMNSKTANDIKLKDYSRERIHTLINSNVGDLKSNKIKFENQIALPCNKRMEESDKVQYNNANNLNVVKHARTNIHYDEEKQNSNPWYRPNYKKPSVVEATATSCDKTVKASLMKGFAEAVDKSEEYPEKTKEYEVDEWVSGNIHKFPVRTHNEYLSKRKQKSDNRCTGESEEQAQQQQMFHPSPKVPLDYKFDKEYPLLGNLKDKERLKTGFENPKAHDRCKGIEFPLVAESKVPPSTTTNYNADMSYKNDFNLLSRNDGITGALQGFNEIKHYRHDNYDDDYYNDYYDYVNDYQQANNAETRLQENESYEDRTDKVPFENYHSENFSPNNRHRFYEKHALKTPEDITLNARQTKVSARKPEGQNIDQYNEHGDDDMIDTYDKELEHFIGGIGYRSQKSNIQTNSPFSKVEKHIWKVKEHQSTSPEHSIQSSQDNLEYKENSSMDNNKPNDYYTSPHTAIKYFPADYQYYEEYYPSEKLNSYQPQGRSQRSPEEYSENDLESDPELETQIQQPPALATTSEIE
jgi:hypothetical protein